MEKVENRCCRQLLRIETQWSELCNALSWDMVVAMRSVDDRKCSAPL